jgi:hypothetical protein
MPGTVSRVGFGQALASRWLTETATIWREDPVAGTEQTQVPGSVPCAVEAIPRMASPGQAGASPAAPTRFILRFLEDADVRARDEVRIAAGLAAGRYTVIARRPYTNQPVLEVDAELLG